jgi:hypothetical protein
MPEGFLNVDASGNITYNGQPFGPMAFLTPVPVSHKPITAQAQYMPMPFVFNGVTYPAGSFLIVKRSDGQPIRVVSAAQLAEDWATV